MNNKKRYPKTKTNLIVDTTFILPALGINVEKEALETIKHFYGIHINYLEVSILEALWKIIKIVPKNKLERVQEGIHAIKETYKQINPPPEAYIDAYKMYHDGHKDYIDNLIYSTSRRTETPLLTIDKDLINFLDKKNYPTNNILTPNKIKQEH